MNNPTTEQAPTTPSEASPIKAPENESALANLAIPLGESVLKLQVEGNNLLYGIVQRNRAVTAQSDFFRVQFRGYARNIGQAWSPVSDEDAHFQNNRNCAWARVDHPSRSITFGPKAGISISDRLHSPGLDEFLFATVISWARHAYPDYSASPGMLMIQGNATEEDRLRKQSFYAKQGFEFEWQDDTQRSGLYYKDKASRLIGVCDNPQVVEFGGEAMLQTLIKQDEEQKSLEARMAKIESMNNAVHQALDKERHTAQALMVVLVVVLLIGLWAML
jgi:hypothetical protein